MIADRARLLLGQIRSGTILLILNLLIYQFVLFGLADDSVFIFRNLDRFLIFKFISIDQVGNRANADGGRLLDKFVAQPGYETILAGVNNIDRVKVIQFRRKFCLAIEPAYINGGLINVSANWIQIIQLSRGIQITAGRNSVCLGKQWFNSIQTWRRGDFSIIANICSAGI